MNFPIKLFTLLLLLVSTTSCIFIPAPFIYVSYGKTAYDTVSFLVDSPSSNDIVLSSLTGMNCRVYNVIDDQDICIEKSATEKIKEYIARYYVASSTDTTIMW